MLLIWGVAASVAAAGPTEAPPTSRPSAAFPATEAAVATTQPSSTYAGANIEHANLDMPIAEFDSGAVALEQAIDRLCRQTHANLVVFWPELEREGVRRDTRVELHLWDTTLGKALESLLVLGGGTWDGYIASHDNMILVGPEASLGDKPRRPTRIYDVRDIIDEAMAYRRSHLPILLPPTTAPASSVNEQMIAEYSQEPVATATGAATAIVDLIQREIDPQSWGNGVTANDNGPGLMEEFAGRLVIVQTEANHRRIAELLHTLRQGGSKVGADTSRHP
ncbi:MAG TPA: hypothetical protein VGI81_19375 [Tepidisphaeraceae bacterium]